eukprot:COSAG02_NODE_53606_length_300_cov_2.353234_1_plen_45_part_10
MTDASLGGNGVLQSRFTEWNRQTENSTGQNSDLSGNPLCQSGTAF